MDWGSFTLTQWGAMTMSEWGTFPFSAVAAVSTKRYPLMNVTGEDRRKTAPLPFNATRRNPFMLVARRRR